MGALKDFERREIERVLSTCTTCGKCYEVCPMPTYSPPLKGARPQSASSKTVVAGVLDVLRGGTGSPEALAWISVCTRSGECVSACPEAVNPKMMMRLARMTALGGLGGERKLPAKEDREYYPRIWAFAVLQLSEDEQKDWL